MGVFNALLALLGKEGNRLRAGANGQNVYIVLSRFEHGLAWASYLRRFSASSPCQGEVGELKASISTTLDVPAGGEGSK